VIWGKQLKRSCFNDTCRNPLANKISLVVALEKLGYFSKGPQRKANFQSRGSKIKVKGACNS